MWHPICDVYSPNAEQDTNNNSKYVIVNQHGRYYQEFAGFKGMARFTDNIVHAWFYHTKEDVNIAIKDIQEWTYEYKRGMYQYKIGEVNFDIKIMD